MTRFIVQELHQLINFFLLNIDLTGNQLGSTLVNELQEEENELKQYIVQLENAEAARATLLSQLKDAVQEQVQLFMLIFQKCKCNW